MEAGKNISVLKIILLLVLLAWTFLCSLIPFALRRAVVEAPVEGRRRGYALVFGLLSCFGGGVFLATCLLDLLPISHQLISEAFSAFGSFNYDTFPLAEFLVAIGFFVVLMTEQIVLWLKESNRDDRSRRSSDPGLLDSIRTDPDSGTEAGDIHFQPEAHSTLRALLLVCALSLHAVFEGLALGLLEHVAGVLQIFGALVIHKSVLGFSLGLRLVQSRLSTRGVVLCCLCFAFMAPFGGSLGVAVVDSVSHQHAALVSGCLQGIACGTFLYITAFEILPHELNESGNRLSKLFSMVLGFAGIALFVLLYPRP